MRDSGDMKRPWGHSICDNNDVKNMCANTMIQSNVNDVNR